MAKRKKTKAATKARKAKTKASGAPKAKRPDGSVSAGIFEAVQKLIADGKTTRSAAFRQIAKEQGRKEGSVNYYYAAKKRGAVKARPRKAKTGKPAAKTAKAATGRGAGISAAILTPPRFFAA